MSADLPSVTFDAVVAGSSTKTGIPVPKEVLGQLGAGQRPAVVVDLDGYTYQTSVGVMAGQHLVPVSAAIRKATGVAADSHVHVTLTLAAGPRTAEVPSDLAEALDREPTAKLFFASLSNSLQRMHVDNVTSAKTPETRQRRIDKCLALFLAGKPR